MQVVSYSDGITITYTHTNKSAAKKYIGPYSNKVLAWIQQNNLNIHSDKTACTLFTPDPAEYNYNLEVRINNITLPMTFLGLTLTCRVICFLTCC